jgi:hypothetical protein
MSWLGPIFTLDWANKIYYDCDDYCDEMEMNINLVFNSGYWNFSGILGRSFLNVYFGDIFQKAGDLTASASYFLDLSV